MAHQIVNISQPNDWWDISEESCSSFRVKLETLKNILSAVGERPISIISICGPGNLGKSFLLNYILRCLDAAEKGVDDWIDKTHPKKPLEGFRWEWHVSYSSPSDMITKGICVWRKPFILKNARGKEFAVIVLDTQGIYDPFSSRSDNKSIMGLCMLLSSVTILNLSSDSDVIEEVFKSLKVFCEYGNLAMIEGIEKPFQKLSLLIRDWNDSPNDPLGNEGGRKFLKKKLKLDDMNQNHKLVEKEIRNYFADIDCFLMPEIGGSGKGRNYDGSFAGLSRAYKASMEEFVSNLVENDTRPRKLGGKFLTATEFTCYLLTYAEMFNGKDYFPSARKMVMITRCIRENLLVGSLDRYLKSFENVKNGPQYFTQKAFENAHREGGNRALEFFRENIKSLVRQQDPKQDNTLQKTLELLIGNLSQKLKRENDEKRTKAWVNAELVALDIFRVQFSEKIKKGIHDETFIMKQANMAKSTAFTEFLNKLCGNESEAEIQNLWRPIQIKFDGMVSSAVPKQKNLRLKRYPSKGKSKNDLLQLDDNGEPPQCFSCPICFDIPEGKVFQCKNGHVICEKCCETVRNCPQCRIHLSGDGKIRNRVMEEIIQNLNLRN